MLNELEHSLTDDEAIEKVRQMKEEIMEKLKDGYDRLVGFETTSKGYEWFGDAPGHEALTGYGLAQFRDMQQVVDFVDEGTLERNTAWLLGRRSEDGSGQF